VRRSEFDVNANNFSLQLNSNPFTTAPARLREHARHQVQLRRQPIKYGMAGALLLRFGRGALLALAFPAMALTGCGGQAVGGSAEVDAGVGMDASADVGMPAPREGGVAEASSPEAGAPEAGAPEAGAPEAGALDAGTDASDAGECVPRLDDSGCDFGIVQCGGSACVVPANSCCEPPADAGTAPVCEAYSACNLGLNLSCDEGADCGPGGACCFFQVVGYYAATYCYEHVPCGGHQSPWQICKTDSECKPDTKCVAESCTLAGAAVSLGFCLGPPSPNPPLSCTPK
jgi:hypothetical protein